LGSVRWRPILDCEWQRGASSASPPGVRGVQSSAGQLLSADWCEYTLADVAIAPRLHPRVGGQDDIYVGPRALEIPAAPLDDLTEPRGGSRLVCATLIVLVFLGVWKLWEIVALALATAVGRLLG